MFGGMVYGMWGYLMFETSFLTEKVCFVLSTLVRLSVLMRISFLITYYFAFRNKNSVQMIWNYIGTL